MPQLNANERRLLSVMGVAVFIVANFFGWMMISDATEALKSEEKKLTATLKKLEKDKLGASEADIKREWIDKNVKTYDSEEQRETYLADLVQGALISGLDIELSKNAPLTTLPGEFFIKSRYKTNARGPWTDVLEFIYRLQKPSALRFVPRITLLPRKGELDDTEQYVEASLELEQWWAKPDGMATSEEAAPEVEQPGAETVNPPAVDASKPATPPGDAAPAVPPVATPPASTPPAAPPPAATPPDSPKPNP